MELGVFREQMGWSHPGMAGWEAGRLFWVLGDTEAREEGKGDVTYILTGSPGCQVEKLTVGWGWRWGRQLVAAAILLARWGGQMIAGRRSDGILHGSSKWGWPDFLRWKLKKKSSDLMDLVLAAGRMDEPSTEKFRLEIPEVTFGPCSDVPGTPERSWSLSS